MYSMLGWTLAAVAGFVVFLVCWFLVVKVSVYGYFKAKQLHDKDLAREQSKHHGD